MAAALWSRAMTQPVYVVDAFTDRPYAGNPAAVCPLDRPAPEPWMRHVAAEMNLAETAFLVPQGDGWNLRWLTPTVEVDLCGHATLASAHVLWETGRLAPDRIAQFHSRSGLLTAQRRDGDIKLDFPATPARPCDAPAGLCEALGCSPRFVGFNDTDYLVEVEDEDAVRRLSPDFTRLSTLKVRGVIVTGRPTRSAGFDFVSRFFAPASGVNEDPVTGSAHCTLGPFWAGRLDKPNLVAFQASARGGVLKVGVRGERVLLVGRAVTVLRGELLHGPGEA
jgi:PhzF family phenazine biosynthesis protein